MPTAYKEGEYVAGKGTYMPDGSFSGAPAATAPIVTPSPAATAPTTVPIPKYKYGDEVKDASGKVIGTAAFDPNTGKPLKQPKVETPKVSINRSIYDDAGSTYKAQTTEQVQRDMLKGAQGEINAINQYASSLLAEQKTINEKNDRSTSSVSSLAGLAGSTEANNAQQTTTAVGQKANKKILQEAEMKVSGIMSRISAAAIAESRAQREEARLTETDRIANRTARQAEAVTNLTNLAASGVTYEGLKASDPKGFEYLAKQFGGDDALKGAFTLNIPQDQILDKKLEGGKYVVVRQNPITQKITVETLDTGLPVGYSKTIDAGNRILAVPDNWDGDPSKLVTINKGLTPAQSAAGGGSGTGADLSSFPPDIQAAAQSILDGKSKLNEYPSAKRLQINAALSKIYTAEGGNELAQGAYDAAVTLKDHKGLGGAVGTNALLGFGKNIPGSASAGFLSQLDTLKANLKLVNIKYLKGTGALSDAEGKTLEDASTSLNPSLPESDFKTELERVTKVLAKAKGVKSGNSNEEVSEEQQLLDAGYTQEQIDALKSQ